MTSSELLARVRGNWIVLLVGLVVTAAACVGVRHHAGVYWSQTNVYLLAPPNAAAPNSILFTTDSVIATAGLVAHLVAPTGNAPTTVTETALPAEGVTDGERVRLPNGGGQWALNFDRPVLDVQVVSPDPEVVRARTEALVGQVEMTVAKMQSHDGIAPTRRITTGRAPVRPDIRYAGGDPRRALVMTLLIGLSGSMMCASLVSWPRRKRSALRVVPLGKVGAT